MSDYVCYWMPEIGHDIRSETSDIGCLISDINVWFYFCSFVKNLQKEAGSAQKLGNVARAKQIIGEQQEKQMTHDISPSRGITAL